MDRSLDAIANADAILFVTDRSVAISPQDLAFRQQIEELFCIVVINKSDLPSAWSTSERISLVDRHPWIEVSAKTGSGMAELRTAILNRILGEDGLKQEGILVTNLRQYHSIKAAEKCFERASSALQEGLSEEFALIDLHGGLRELGAITGELAIEDLLTEIFSRFCVGK